MARITHRVIEQEKKTYNKRTHSTVILEWKRLDQIIIKPQLLDHSISTLCHFRSSLDAFDVEHCRIAWLTMQLANDNLELVTVKQIAARQTDNL